MIITKNKNPFKRVSSATLKQGPTTAKINVQLDARTRITIKDISALELWIGRYPNAKVIS